MTKRFTLKDIDSAYKAGQKTTDGHNKPSPETQNFMIKITEEMNFIKEKLENMPTKQEMELCNEKLVDRILKEAEKRFASKLTERIVYTMVGIIIAYVLGKWLNLI